MKLRKKNEASKNLSDEEIVQQIVSESNTDLFSVLYDRYAPIIYRKCLSMTQSDSTAKDLMQDIIIKVFLNISQFGGRSNFSLWVNTISYNHCMLYFRLKKRLIIAPEDISEYKQLPIDEIEQEHSALEAIKAKELEELLGKLKEEYRLILFMRYFSEMSVKEIAESLEIGESAVKMRLKRGREKLHELYKNKLKS